ncbi:MAG: alpha/beta hydrolase [Bacteroidales bacterium]|nr:alpha/beta hydrolase [Bacteroidales bacterium]
MKKVVLLIFAVFVSVCYLETEAQSRVVEFDSPKMKVFLPPANMTNGRAVVACPGGGYTHLAQNHEGYYWAPYFNSLGYAYAVVEYRFPEGNRDIPMDDVKCCFKAFSDSAEVWKINPGQVGIMGSSAGGHLASALATHPTANCKPAFQILFYPVISLENDITHGGTRRGFLGENPSEELVSEWSSDQKVDSDTPPVFLALCSDDKVVKPINSILYYNALVDAGVPVAMFVYPTGGHGWGYRSKFKQHDQMIDELTAWLKNLKFNSEKE